MQARERSWRAEEDDKDDEGGLIPLESRLEASADSVSTVEREGALMVMGNQAERSIGLAMVLDNRLSGKWVVMVASIAIVENDETHLQYSYSQERSRTVC